MSGAQIMEQAEGVVRAVFDAVEEMRWDDVVRLIDPIARERFRATALENERHVEKSFPATPTHRNSAAVEDGPSLPEQREQDVYSPASHRLRVYGVASIPELEELTAEEMLSRYLKAGDQRTGLLAQIEREGIAIPEDLRGRDLGGERFQIVGSVVEDAEKVHVVYRTSMASGAMGQSNLDVVSVRRSDAGWRVWPRREEPKLFGGFTYWPQVVPQEELRRLREEAAASIVEWSDERGRHHRTYLIGGSGHTVRALVIERSESGEAWEPLAELPQRTFREVFQMLMQFAHQSAVRDESN